MRPFETAMPPSSITRRVWSMVTIVPPRTSKSTGCRRVWAVTGESMVIKIRETQIKADLFTDIIALFQESGVEGAWEKIGNVKPFALSFEVRKYDLRTPRKLPDNLTARSTRWR